MYDLQFIVNRLVLDGRRRYYEESETRMNKDRVGVVPEAGDRVKTFLKLDLCSLIPELRLRITPFGKGTSPELPVS